MEIRGERECKACGTRWSYYETGSVACPECGSLRSVGVDERAEHTDVAVSLDLDDARAAAGDGDLRTAAEYASEAVREYVRERGFVRGGDLRDLDDTYLAACELKYVAAEVDRGLAPEDAEELYVLSLLRGAASGDRPDPDAVPDSMRAARGLAVASAVEHYLDDLRTWLDGTADAPEARHTMETLRDHVKRVQALDGDVPPANADRLATAANELAAFLRGEDDELDRARERLHQLA